MDTTAKGVAVSDYLKEVGARQFIVLASLPDTEEGGFSLLMGDLEMLTSLLVMVFRSNPELYLAATSTLLKIACSVTDEQLAKNMEAQGKGCDCGNCKGENKGKDEVSLEDFTAKGKYKH